jgi:alpha-L-arabinofuranosidase
VKTCHGRREFLALAASAAACTLLPRSARAADSRIEILLGEPIGPIAPEVYGHFVEDLGAVVYDGVFVGLDSKIENVGGIRKALVDHMKRLPAGVIRWPGGCFADSYDWRDGVGPAAARPRRTNFWAERLDPNTFGTNEFVRFCRLSGMQPYLAANLRSLPARDFYQWVDYCNAPAGSTTLAQLRGLGGEREPLGVRYWGVGNEAWGCGGDFLPEEYASEFRRFTSWVPRYGVDLAFVGSGPSSDDIAWTRRVFAKLAEKGEGQVRRLWGWAVHHYSWNLSRGATTDWERGKGDALRFGPEEWYELLNEGDKLETLVGEHWAAMGEFDRSRRVRIAVDEWGAWYRPGSEADPSHLLGQTPTMRDALLSALTLDLFHRQADKVAMANVAQLVNCLHSLFLAHEDRFVATPNFHVFEMYAPHVGGQSLRTVFAAPRVSYDRVGPKGSLWGLGGSASLKGKTMTLTVVNPHVSEAREAEVALLGGAITGARATTLAAGDIHAHNTFDEPRAIEPAAAATAAPRAGALVHRFPPASVTRLTLDIA